MLTKADFNEIRKILREEVEAEGQNIQQELQTEMKMNMIRTVSELRELNSRMKNTEVKISKIQKDLKSAVNFLDKDGLKVQKRVKRIEEHLNLEPASI